LLFLSNSIKDITKPWREIVDPTGTTISQVQRYVQRNKMYYLAADPNDFMFANNLDVCKGVFPSPSFVREKHPELKGAVSHYEVMHSDKEKESTFEKVRAEYYPSCPSRMGAIYLFNNLDTAIHANQEWWKNQRTIYEATIEKNSNVLITDSQWLNCAQSEYEKNAHNYFQEKYTDNPILEVVVMGVIQVASEPVLKEI